jgi:hypothetical protein
MNQHYIISLFNLSATELGFKNPNGIRNEAGFFKPSSVFYGPNSVLIVKKTL